MAPPLPDWASEAAAELAPLLRRAMAERERRDCAVFRPSSWRLLAALEQASAERRAEQAEKDWGGTDVCLEGGTSPTMVSVTEVCCPPGY
jgi:hypothetical protein